MIFAVDVGNTHIAIGCIEGSHVHNIGKIVTNKLSTISEYAVKLRQLLEFEAIDLKQIDGAILSSVVPSVTDSVRIAIEKLLKVQPLVVGAGIRTGFNIKIDAPSTMGADLVALTAATIEEYGAPAIVLDMDTATTISVIDRNASYIGGAIIPGMLLSLNALISNTSLLQNVSIEAPRKTIATNTADCMRSGVVYGSAAMIDGMIDRMTDELLDNPIILATGSMARIIVPHCRHDIVLDNDLLLKGLGALYRRNKH